MTEAIDTSVWVAYFRGDARVRELIETSELITSTIAIAELAALFAKQELSFEKELLYIKSRAKIVPLTAEIALLAASIKHERRKQHKKFGLADALHYATAKEQGVGFVTLDNDFSGMSGTRIIR